MTIFCNRAIGCYRPIRDDIQGLEAPHGHDEQEDGQIRRLGGGPCADAFTSVGLAQRPAHTATRPCQA